MFDTKESVWIETYNGHKFNFYYIKTNTFDIEDIAHSLSMQCRYNGHTKRFYSVAEHDCHMYDWVEAQPWSTPQDALMALHHDDAEYVIGDVARPFKQQLPDFKAKELEIDQEIARRFDLPYPFPKWLKDLDTAMLVAERHNVMRPTNNVWTEIETDLDFDPNDIKFWNILGRWPAYVKRQWLERHYQAMAQR
jgi:hypothetical protein